ncbi:MAG: GNAT family N-acetyltransferase [Lachnospiraceae bacterium]|nr:GNAT family N-acetyltransferase [Lachnospiraceae bacterium]
MKTDLYTLTQSNVKYFSMKLPDFIYEKVDSNGFFTLGAVGYKGDDGFPIGMAQFHSNITRDGRFFVEIVYLYVMEEFRRNGIGSKLIDRVRKINKKCDIETLTILIPSENNTELGLDISPDEMAKFFDILGFSKVDVNLKMYETVLTENHPNLEETDVVRYTKFLKL